MANKVDISNLPTPEELTAKPSVDISNLPTPDQLSTPSQPVEKKFPTGEFARRELLEGLTGGFSEELAGLGAGASQAVTGDYGPTKGRSWQNILDAYQQMKSQEEGKRKALEANAPFGATTALQTVGSLPLAIATGPLGAIRGGAALGATAALGTSQAPLVGPEADYGAAAKDVAIGATLGAGLGALGGKLASKTTSEALETAASKQASAAAGLKPTKEFSSIYDDETGQIIKGSDIIKGVGTSAMKEGALPWTGGPNAMYDKALEAISVNKAKLAPLLDKTQQELTPNILNILQDTGPIESKINDLVEGYLDKIPYNSKTSNLIKTLQNTANNYIPRLSQADGNLPALNQLKGELQQAATDLSSNVFQDGSNASYEADLLKRMGGVVRQHIEDMANYASEDAGNQIHEINSTLQNMQIYRDAAKKAIDKGDSGSDITKILDLPTKILTDNTVNRLAKIATAKAENLASKVVSTPVGPLVQKAIVNVPLATITNPFTQGRVQQKYNPPEATKLATNLYNATDDSLKQVASKLKQTTGLEFYGDHLNNAIDTQDEGEKQRAIFLILQQPKARKLVTPTDVLTEQTKKALESSNNR